MELAEGEPKYTEQDTGRIAAKIPETGFKTDERQFKQMKELECQLKYSDKEAAHVEKKNGSQTKKQDVD